MNYKRRQKMIIENGKTLSTRQAKQRIIELNKWSESRYQKEMTLIRRGLERFGVQQNPQQFLFAEAKTKARYKSNYKPSQYIKQIRHLAKIKGRQIRSGKRSIIKTKRLVQSSKLDYINHRFGGLINANKGARRIYEKYINDVYHLEQELTNYANRLHAKIDKEERIISAQAIPFSSEQYGSDIEV